jgi:hypothetical protein
MPPRSLCASSSVPLLSTLLLSTQQLSGVTSSSSIESNRGMDDEDGDSDAGASEHVCSPGIAMRSGNMLPYVHIYRESFLPNFCASFFYFWDNQMMLDRA